MSNKSKPILHLCNYAKTTISNRNHRLCSRNLPTQGKCIEPIEWGLVNGKITDIVKDFVVINEQPVFKVRCILEKQEVSLPTGYKATLKKGMSLRARFIVTKRSLFQLLYDKVDDWVNPNLNRIN